MTKQLPADFFRRVDDSDDELFYSTPRLVVHIDDGAIAKVGEIYARLLPQGGAILAGGQAPAQWLTDLLVKLVSTYPKFAAVLVIVGGLRLTLKPLFAFAHQLPPLFWVLVENLLNQYFLVLICNFYHILHIVLN